MACSKFVFISQGIMRGPLCVGLVSVSEHNMMQNQVKKCFI